MAVTGKTGADTFYKSVKKQQEIWTKYGPKLQNVCAVMHGAGLLSDAEYTALTTAFASVPTILAAIAKVADYSGF